MRAKPTDGLWLLLEAPDRFGGQRYLRVEPEDTAVDLARSAMRLFRRMYDPQDLTLIDWSLNGRAIDAGPGRYTRQMREAIAAILEEIELED